MTKFEIRMNVQMTKQNAADPELRRLNQGALALACPFAEAVPVSSLEF
jgi:hypothetical protein